jgi:hypothetical protein
MSESRRADREDRKAAINVEFIHLYAGSTEMTEEIRHNLHATEGIVSLLEAEGLPFCLTALIDDYSVDQERAALRNASLEFVLSLEPCPDYVAWESSLVPLARDLIADVREDRLLKGEASVSIRTHTCDVELVKQESDEDTLAALLGHLPQQNGPRVRMIELQPDTSQDIVVSWYEDRRERYTCAALTAAWHLCRLGMLDLPECEMLTLRPAVPFVAEGLWTILPTRYLHVESAALGIIESLQGKRFKRARRRMEYFFHRTRGTGELVPGGEPD